MVFITALVVRCWGICVDIVMVKSIQRKIKLSKPALNVVSKFYKPPTIQEREEINPEYHLALIYDTAFDMIDSNSIYLGKAPKGEMYDKAFAINVAGIKNGLKMGTATIVDNKILFWHPGKGEYVKYDKELQDYLLGFIRETKELWKKKGH
jgi:hypothetical protein